MRTLAAAPLLLAALLLALAPAAADPPSPAAGDPLPPAAGGPLPPAAGDPLPPAAGDPLPRERVPEPLRPWIDWVLHGEEAARCPFLHGAVEATRCAWPARLALDLEARAGRFTQEWFLHVGGPVPLPGDERIWPLDVRVDGAPAPVVPRGGVPSVRLGSGRHTVAGRFAWPSLPESLPVPADTGLVSLTLAGRRVPFPNRDDQGRLWLARAAGAGQADDRLEVRVHRRVEDDIPLVLITRVDLEVSGRNRELLLGRALPDHFVPMRLESRLPARVEPDGRLRVQVRPGTWTVEVAARHDGPASALSPGAPGGPWADAEVWVFDARPALRLVTVEGVPAVDPAQTTLPEPWKALPAYRVAAADTLRLVEKRRGDADPAPDRLTLRRAIWLDFDGGGFSVRDEIAGTMRRSWRLEMSPPTTLGRVAVDGRDQFITRLPGSPLAGVEIRQGEVDVTADSRVARRGALPAVGWNHAFQEVQGELNLPPGWRLFSAAGADDVGDSWIATWSLLDLFLVLVVAMAVRALYGWRWGAIALVTLVLAFPEPGAPGWLWLAVLAGEALVRALGQGRARRVLLGYRLAALVLLILVSVPFLVRQMREALYPVLERPQVAMGGPVQQALLERGRMERAEQTRPAPARPLKSAPGSLDYYSSSRELTEIDPKAVVQTGPGLPEWRWRSARLGFRGPVEPGQTIRLVLLSPAVNALLALARVALVALLVVRLLGLPAERLPRRLSLLFAALAVAWLAAGGLPGPGEAWADTPSPEILAELKRRLLAKPACAPACAAIPRLEVAASPATLRARLEVGAEAATAVPLPGAAQQWSPDRVVLDGEPARALLRAAGGVLWLEVPPGVHQVLLEGPLPDRDTVQVPLPLKPRRVTVEADGWTVDGVGDEGAAADALQLTRVRRSATPDGGRLAPGALPPFVRVDRTLRLGLTWQVETRVARVTPPGSAVVLEVPLVDGESVTTSDVRVAGGRALVAMGPQVSEVQWRSTLAPRDAIRLAAPAALGWTETWRLDASPVWHVALAGIPRIHHHDQRGIWMPEWRPWPGEAVTIAVTRPEGLPGQTLTLDGSLLVLRPGGRATDAALTLRLRSSRGGEHALTLPEGAELLSVALDGTTQPIRQEGRGVTLPVGPGAHEAQVDWREPRGMGVWFRSSEVNLGAPGVNAAVEVHLPADRWLLFARGPRMGPAVLFWSFLAVLVLLAAALGRVTLTPLRSYQWLLLGVGLSQVHVGAAAVVVVWFLALGLRRARGDAIRSEEGFNLVQVLLALWTALAMVVLFVSVQQGLLGHPDMQVAGNGSSRFLLRWFQDRSAETLPRPWVLSVPLLVYRGAMLAWALWLAVSLIGWVRWGWGCVTEGGLWRRVLPVKTEG